MNSYRVVSVCGQVIEIIFSSLNAKDLNSCAQVCTLWNAVAEAEKERRSDIRWLFQKVRSCSPERNPHFTYNKCIHENENTNLEVLLHEKLDSVSMPPLAFCMVFVSYHLFESFRDFFPSFYNLEEFRRRLNCNIDVTRRSYMKTILKKIIKPHLPACCSLTFTVSVNMIGMIGTDDPGEVFGIATMAAIFLPKATGVQVRHFPIHNTHCNLATFLEENEPVKCILLFLSERGTAFADELATACVLRIGPNVTLGGSIAKHTESLLGSAIVFSGPGVEAASIVLRSHHRPREVEKKLMAFEAAGLLKNRCIAFMFVCEEYRTRHHYYKLRSSIFCSIYPHVPLTVVFGKTDIAFDYIPHASLDDRVFEPHDDVNMRFLYFSAVVFVMISMKV